MALVRVRNFERSASIGVDCFEMAHRGRVRAALGLHSCKVLSRFVVVEAASPGRGIPAAVVGPSNSAKREAV